MAALTRHGIAVHVPEGWEARIFRPRGGGATLHAASFALPPDDGEFGARTTRAMPPDGVFLALTEYRADDRLRPGTGLFAGTQPRAIALHELSPAALLAARPGQLGAQRFFTAASRPFCLYLVLGSTAAARRLGQVRAMLRALAISPAPPSG